MSTEIEVIEIGFSGATQFGEMQQYLGSLARRSIDFAVLDDRGGTGMWMVIIEASMLRERNCRLPRIPVDCHIERRPSAHVVYV